MQALINAGGKGTRMGACGTEKPMQDICGKPSIQRVVDALSGSHYVDRILVSVSDNTLNTEEYLKSVGVDTVRTSGKSFMDDLHEAFEVMSGNCVLTCPSDIPLLSTEKLDNFIHGFGKMHRESYIALVDCAVLNDLGITPSYQMEFGNSNWAVSGISIMDRLKTIRGDYLLNSYFYTDCREFAVNVNTQRELGIARKLFEEKK